MWSLIRCLHCQDSKMKINKVFFEVFNVHSTCHRFISRRRISFILINNVIFCFLVSEATSAPSPILHRDLSLKHTLTSCLSQPQASRLEPNLHPAAQFSTSVCPLSGETNTKTDSPSNSSFTVLFLHEGWFLAALTPYSLRLASNETLLYRGQKHIPNISSFLRRCKD